MPLAGGAGDKEIDPAASLLQRPFMWANPAAELAGKQFKYISNSGHPRTDSVICAIDADGSLVFIQCQRNLYRLSIDAGGLVGPQRQPTATAKEVDKAQVIVRLDGLRPNPSPDPTLTAKLLTQSFFIAVSLGENSTPLSEQPLAFLVKRIDNSTNSCLRLPGLLSALCVASLEYRRMG